VNEDALTIGADSGMVLPDTQVQELIRTLVRGQRAFQMYLPNNPIYHKAVDRVRVAFRPIWAATDELVLQVAETDFVWEGMTVYQEISKSESLAWQLYKDGMRVLTFKDGVQDEEIVRFLQTVNQVKLLPTDAADDLRTVLWEQDYQHLTYRFTDILEGLEGLEPSGDGMPSTPPDALQEEVRQDVQEAAPAAQRPGVVDLDEFDSTPYFLDESEIDFVRQEVEKEYHRDLRTSAFNALFDVFEQQHDRAVREEIVGILDTLFPNMLNAGEFKACAAVLRETRALAERADDGFRERLAVFDAQLSEPSVVSQMLQSLDEAATPPREEDVVEILQELQPRALETLFVWLPKFNSGPLRRLVSDVAGHIGERHPAEVVRLLQDPKNEGLSSAIALAGRLKLEPAIPGLANALNHDEADTRFAVVEALGAIGTPSAMGKLEPALGDPERTVRMAAVRLVGERGFKGALSRIEQVVFRRRHKSMDFNEKRAFFEAYGAIAGAAAVRPLGMMLRARGIFRRKRSSEVRMCAALGLGKVGSPEAREILERVRDDRDRQVKNAVAAALRVAKS
jgi:HEAT repeat protein